MPLRLANEHYILKRESIEFELIIEKLGLLKGTGYCILSSSRIILMNTTPNSKMKAFDLPLALMYQENYIQPIFGANYIEGFVEPLTNS